MPSQPKSLTPIQFLSAGNIITASLQLYRQHFKPYFRLALIGTVWLIVPLALLVGSVLLLANSGDWAWLLVGIVPATVASSFLWGFAHYQAYAATIARLAFGELNGAAEPLAEAMRYTTSRKWGFWLIGFLLFLIYVGLAIGLYVLLAIGLVVAIVAVGGTAFLQNPAATPQPEWIAAIAAIFGILLLAIGIPAIVLLLWIAARLFVAEVPYAIEPDLQPGSSISRSWKLTARNSGRLILVFMVAAAVWLPLQFLHQLVTTALQGVAVVIDPNQSSTAFVGALVASYALSLLLNILVTPFWQTTKAITYYDLRSRREGMGLVLDDSNDDSDTVSPPFSMLHLFKQVKLLTPESVELEFTLAGIGNRTLAVLVDYGIILLGWLLFWVLWGVFSFQLMNYLESLNTDYSNVPLWLLAIGILLTFLFTTGYFAGFEVLRQGQTPGKRYARIRVVRDDGRPVGLAQTLLRALLQPIDYTFFLGAFLIFWGKSEKRLGDWAAGTLVIQENQAMKRAITLSPEAKQLAPELPAITDLAQLRPDQFAIVNEYLQRRSFMETQARSELSLELARQIRPIIQLETIPQGLTSDQFLEAVYLAYQQGMGNR
ncbi:MAG: RDD family protein [Elainellaceae cyanobacterium]